MLGETCSARPDNACIAGHDVVTIQYFNGMRLDGRRTVPHLQRLLIHLDTELTALETAAGA